MKKLLLICVVISFIFCSLSFAQGDKVALLDMTKVMKESNPGKKLSARLEKAKKDKEADLKKREDQILDIRKKLESSTQVLSDSKKLELKQQEEKLLLQYKAERDNAQQDLYKLQAAINQDYNKVLMPILEDYCKKNGFTVVIPTNIVLWFDSSRKMNITDDFIKLVNQKITN